MQYLASIKHAATPAVAFGANFDQLGLRCVGVAFEAEKLSKNKFRNFFVRKSKFENKKDRIWHWPVLNTFSFLEKFFFGKLLKFLDRASDPKFWVILMMASDMKRDSKISVFTFQKWKLTFVSLGAKVVWQDFYVLLVVHWTTRRVVLSIIIWWMSVWAVKCIYYTFVKTSRQAKNRWWTFFLFFYLLSLLLLCKILVNFFFFFSEPKKFRTTSISVRCQNLVNAQSSLLSL